MAPKSGVYQSPNLSPLAEASHNLVSRPFAMACPKCGCRMATKVGRSKTMLICSDCGHPLGQARDEQLFKWRHLATVVFLAAVAGVALALSLVSEFVSREQFPLSEPAGQERGE